MQAASVHFNRVFFSPLVGNLGTTIGLDMGIALYYTLSMSDRGSKT